jgi:hypothetical protein
MVIGLVKLAPNVGMRLTIEIMGKHLISVGAVLHNVVTLGAVCARHKLLIVMCLGLTERLPSLAPASVKDLTVANEKLRDNALLLILISKANAHSRGLYGNVLHLNAVLVDVKASDKTLVPHLILSVAGEMEIALTVKDMTALKALKASDAMAVLTKYHVRAATNHLAASLHKSRRRIAAKLLTAVIDHNNTVGISLCLADVLHGLKLVEGSCALAVLKRIGIFMLTNVDDAHLDAVALKIHIFSGILIILAITRVSETDSVKLFKGIVCTLLAKVENVVVGKSAIGNARRLQSISGGLGTL